MSLDTLPQELILEIALCLPKKAIVSLGLRSRNKQISMACKPLLKQLAMAKRFERRMLERFGNDAEFHSTNLPRNTEEQYLKLGYDKRLGAHIEDRPASGRCLKPFIGDLGWVQPTD